MRDGVCLFVCLLCVRDGVCLSVCVTMCVLNCVCARDCICLCVRVAMRGVCHTQTIQKRIVRAHKIHNLAQK